MSTSSKTKTTTTTTDDESQNKNKNDLVPIYLLSGFLGSGKTSTLQHLLENTDGVQIGVVVNDVASVNIDAKLVSSTSAASALGDAGANNDIVELQNGCACCSLADELLTTVESLLDSRRNKNGTFDAVVVELSGVSDPIAIKSNWNAAKMQGHPVTTKADIEQIITLVDATTFGTDWMTWDVAGERDGWVDPADDCAARRKIPELLAEQIEAANMILINKIDLAPPEQVKVAAALAKTINDKAIMEEVAFGRVAPQDILKSPSKTTTSHEDEKSSSSGCHDPECTDKSHSHSHSHDHDHDNVSTSNHHSHDHDNTESSSTACTDPDCTDTTHSHSHSHSHETDLDNLGITNFVYQSSRPFDSKKLLPLLSTWPVPEIGTLDLDVLKEAAQQDGYSLNGNPEKVSSPFVGVLRSKGVCWLAPSKWTGPYSDAWRHDTAMYWSHAGTHFGITSAGKVGDYRRVIY
jgi:G3E family GTPase